MTKKKMPADDEMLEVVDRDGEVLRLAPRTELHANPALLHRVVHVLVLNGKGQLLLQKRSMNKDVAPGKWDTSVGGHVNPGEDVHAAALRELKEELGMDHCEIRFLYTYFFSNDRESELVSTFTCTHSGDIVFAKDEIDEVRFWEFDRIQENIGKGVFSSHFEKEFAAYIINQDRIQGK